MSPDGKTTPGWDPPIYEDDVCSKIVTPRDGELRCLPVGESLTETPVDRMGFVSETESQMKWCELRPPFPPLNLSFYIYKTYIED